MEIYTPTEISETIFNDYLEPPEPGMRADATKAQIGRPEWWFLNDLVKDWKPPQGDDTYLLIRLSFSLSPPKGHRVEEVNLVVNLKSSDPQLTPVAFDLFPREVLEEAQTDLKVTLNPTFKWDKVEISPGSVETTIHIPKVEPIITTEGIGRVDPQWHFRHHRRYPIIGSRMVYMIVAYPSSAKEMEISLDLNANVQAGRFGLWFFKVPQKAKAQLSQTLP